MMLILGYALLIFCGIVSLLSLLRDAGVLPFLGRNLMRLAITISLDKDTRELLTRLLNYLEGSQQLEQAAQRLEAATSKLKTSAEALEERTFEQSNSAQR